MDNPEVLVYVRVAYVASQVIILGMYYYTSLQIKKKNDTTVLKYVEPKNPMSQDSGELVTTTVREYDLGEVSKLLRGVYIGIAMMSFMHLYMKYTQPLFIQALMGIKALAEAKPIAIHVFGKKAEGDLKRPFKAGGMFGAAGEPATDKASIKEAEGKISSKKDE